MDSKNNTKAAIVALTAVFSVAICFIILGAVSVELMPALGLNEGQFGTLVMGLFLTCCIVQLFIGPMVDKLGYKPVALVGFIVTGASMLVLSFANTFSTALFASILMGIGAMSLNTVGNTLIPVVLYDGKDPARASNFGNAFFALGYIIIPLLVVLMLRTFNLNYNISLIIIGVLLFIFFIFALTVKFPNVSAGFQFSQAFKVLFKPAVLIAALALFCYISLEVSLGTWARALMGELYAQSGVLNAETKTGIVLSLFGVSMMVGRFLTSLIKNLTVIGVKLIIAMSALALISIIIMMIAKNPVWGIIAIILAGLAFAPIFPTIVGVTFSKFEPGLYGSIFGIIFSVGLLGGTFIPKLIGNLSVGSTTQESLLIAAIMAALLIVFAFLIGLTGKPKNS